MTENDTKSRILAAATKQFLQHGFGNTNLDQIAQQAGVTKPTVYSHFGSKQKLFNAMVDHYASSRVDEFRANLQATGDTRSDLMRFAEVFLTRVLSEESRAWQRLATAESATYPKVGQAFFDAGPKKVFAHLTDYLKGEKKAGRLQFANAQSANSQSASAKRAAEQFLGMLLGLDLLRSLVGQPAPTAAETRRRCRETVATFLDAYATSNSESTNG